MDVVKAVVEGSVEITLSGGEKVLVKPLSLRVLREMLTELSVGEGIPSGLEMIPMLLKVPAHLARLCGKELEWFEDLPVVDVITVAETVFDISQMEVVILRFLALRKRGEALVKVPAPSAKLKH